jgi:hypothetical protein
MLVWRSYGLRQQPLPLHVPYKLLWMQQSRRTKQRTTQKEKKKMKRILSAAALLLLMAAPTYAATLTFAWDPKPADQNWTKVRLYEKSGTTYTLLIEVAGTATQATVTSITPGAHSFVARSFDGTWESADSNTVVTGLVPNPPGNIKILSVVLASVGVLAAMLLMIFRKK